MLRVLTDYHDFTFSLDDLALFADLLYGWFNFHCTTIPFLWFFMSYPTAFAVSVLLFCSPGYSAFIEVVYRHLNSNLITRQNSDIVHAELSRYVSRYDMLVGKLHLEGGVGKCLNNCTLKFDYVIFTQNNPSFLKIFAFC